MKDVAVNKMNLIKGGGSDETGCYVSSLAQVGNASRGEREAVASVTALTLVKGKVIQINMASVVKNKKIFTTLFKLQKENIKRLLALLGNQ